MSGGPDAPRNPQDPPRRIVGRWGEALISPEAPPAVARAVLAALEELGGIPPAAPPGAPAAVTEPIDLELGGGAPTGPSPIGATADDAVEPDPDAPPGLPEPSPPTPSSPAETGVWIDPDDLVEGAWSDSADAAAGDGPVADTAADADSADDAADRIDQMDPVPRYPEPEPGSGRRRRRSPSPAASAPGDGGDSSGPQATRGYEAQAAPVPMVTAAICMAGHANPPDVLTCQCCPAPLSGQLAPVPRPVLAMLAVSTGLSVPVRGDMIVGRAPQAQPGGEAGTVLLEVPSPSHLVSRSHLEITTAGWNVLARDLGSNNGTVLLRPGLPAVLLATALPTPLYMGDLLDIGDGVTLRVEPPV